MQQGDGYRIKVEGATTRELIQGRSTGETWNPQSSVLKPAAKKKTRTILVPAFKPPKYDNPRIRHITEMFLAPAFKNPKPQKPYASQSDEDFRLSKNSWVQNTGTRPRAKDCTSRPSPSVYPISQYPRVHQDEMRFIYSKLQDSPEADEYEKQNFRTSNSWYRLSEKQRADFDLNFREDMQKATKNDRINKMLDAVTSSKTTGKFSKQSMGVSKNPSKKSNFLQRLSVWFGNRRKNLYRK